jgi:insertion element IS1 protein InsB
MIMIVREHCPECGSTQYKKNGHIHNGKQNYRCKVCGREFVLNPEPIVISAERRELIKKLLLERISLRGICRSVGVSMEWLLEFITETYDQLPDHLNAYCIESKKDIVIQTLECEADELWSFVDNKNNKQWVWLAMDTNTRQIIAFHVGDRSRESAKKLWANIPEAYRTHAIFYTDQYESYEGVIPSKQHYAVPKQAGKTSHIERFNCTLRQRVSRLVRKALSFSKKLENHIGAIKYFICHYNLIKAEESIT